MIVWILHWRSTTKPGGGVLRVFSDEESGTDAWDLLHCLQIDDREFFLDRYEVTE